MDAADTRSVSSPHQEGDEEVIPLSCAEEEEVQSNDEAACVTLKANISDHDDDGSDLHSTDADGERANNTRTIMTDPLCGDDSDTAKCEWSPIFDNSENDSILQKWQA